MNALESEILAFMSTIPQLICYMKKQNSDNLFIKWEAEWGDKIRSKLVAKYF